MSDRAVLPEGKIREGLHTIPGWEYREGKLRREYRFADFTRAWAFLSGAASEAQAMNHHPEWSNTYSRVSIVLWTHDRGGVTPLDLALAARLEELAQALLPAERVPGGATKASRKPAADVSSAGRESGSTPGAGAADGSGVEGPPVTPRYGPPPRKERSPMTTNPCHALNDAGTSVWLDQLSRSLVIGGRLSALMNEVALCGVTSNPAIFHKAMTVGTAYDEQIAELRGQDMGIEEFYENLAVRDIQDACDVLRPAWERCLCADGFVSLEVSPHLARDADGTVAAARRLRAWVDRPNVLIKVPGTPECMPAIEQLLSEGVGVNITLLFAVEAYEEVAWTYIRALGQRMAAGHRPEVPSVASFFVSRIDTMVDALLEERARATGGNGVREEILSLRGKAAVANAKIAYQSFRKIFWRPEFLACQREGARVQKPLWASTSTKNPEYRDVMYVEPLIGRETVNTMPMETIEAFCEHGQVELNTVEQGIEEAHAHLARLEEVGISFRDVTDRLLEEGIDKFVQPYDQLLAALEAKRKAVR